MEQVVQGGMMIHSGLLMVVQLISPLVLLMQSLQHENIKTLHSPTDAQTEVAV